MTNTLSRLLVCAAACMGLSVGLGFSPTIAQAAELGKQKSSKPRIAPAGRQFSGSKAKARAKALPQRQSLGQVIGLHQVADPLSLKSGAALVIDPETNEILFSKNSGAVLPIASITKLMTAMVVADAGLPLDEMLTVGPIDQLETGKSSSSRLTLGMQLSRGDLMHLALMASENRAAYALGSHYPGGMRAFVGAMNAKATELGMTGTRYVEPTGLSSQNRSSAQDLSTLVRTAMNYSLIKELSTSQDVKVPVGKRVVQFRNTNGLIRNPEWDISLQKTGYISEAGRCVVMQAKLAGRQLIMILLDSAGRYSRIGDAERIKAWVMKNGPARQNQPPLSNAAETEVKVL